MKQTRREFIKTVAGVAVGCVTIPRILEGEQQAGDEQPAEDTQDIPPGVLVIKGLSYREWEDLYPSIAKALQEARETNWATIPILYLPLDASVEYLAFDAALEKGLIEYV